MTGVYRWVDVLYTNRLVNYGKRLMYEFMVPEPARLYMAALQQLAEAAEAEGDATLLEEPVPLDDNGIYSADDIGTDNYLDLARAYDVTLQEPPSPETKTSTQSFSPTDDPDSKERVYTFAFPVDSGYQAEGASATLSFKYHLYSPNEVGTYFTATIGNETFQYDKDNLDATGIGDTITKSVTKTMTFDETWIDSLPIKVEIKNVHSFTVTLELTVAVQEEAMEAWRATAYDALMRGYEAQVAAYESAVEEAAASAATAAEEAETSVDTSLNRAIEQRELKRLCIDMMARPFGIELGQDFYLDDSACKGLTIPYVNQAEAWETYSDYARFFEQVFEWESMAYLFYPYYWADKCLWYDLLQTTSTGDLIFEGFLQSGMARVLVPVRPGYEDALCFYLESGEIWSGGDLVFETADDLYASVLEELQSVDGFVEEEWTSRVPTTLTIVQGKSVYLEDESLPCCKELESDGTTSGFIASSALLGESADDTTEETASTDVPAEPVA